MKPITPAMLTLIQSSAQFSMAELYTFTFLDGSKDYFTNLDIPITYGGNVYKANSIRIEGLKLKLSIGFSVDEQEARISATPTDTLGGSAFFQALEDGLLDGAYLVRARGFWAATYGPAYQDFAGDPVDVIPIFTGRVSTITKIGRTHVELKLKSPLSLLDIDMPRNTYEPGCQWNLYDGGCTLNRASFTNSFTVSSSDPVSITPTVAVSPNVGADGVPYYLQGRLLFTSGLNNNLQVLVKTNDGVKFYLQYPIAQQPAPGDTFAVSAGCIKTSATCTAKFANIANFRGFPRVPPIFVSL